MTTLVSQFVPCSGPAACSMQWWWSVHFCVCLSTSRWAVLTLTPERFKAAQTYHGRALDKVMAFIYSYGLLRSNDIIGLSALTTAFQIKSIFVDMTGKLLLCCVQGIVYACICFTSVTTSLCGRSDRPYITIGISFKFRFRGCWCHMCIFNGSSRGGFCSCVGSDNFEAFPVSASPVKSSGALSLNIPGRCLGRTRRGLKIEW